MRTDGQPAVMKLIVVFRNFANAPKRAKMDLFKINLLYPMYKCRKLKLSGKRMKNVILPPRQINPIRMEVAYTSGNSKYLTLHVWRYLCPKFISGVGLDEVQFQKVCVLSILIAAVHECVVCMYIRTTYVYTYIQTYIRTYVRSTYVCVTLTA